MSDHSKKRRISNISEAEKIKLRKRANALISRYCAFAALVIILITFAAFILGKANGFFSQCGIMVSIALIALALINDPERK